MAQTQMKWGKVVIISDARSTSSQAYANPSASTEAYVTNILSWFKGGRGGRFVNIDADTALLPPLFGATVTRNGGTLDWVSSPPGDLSDYLAKYDGVFLCRVPVDASDLLDYVNAGGCVYIGAGGSVGESSAWNAFLSHFGVALQDGADPFTGLATLAPDDHPIMQGVTSLYLDGPSPIGVPATNPSLPSAQIVGVWGKKPVVIVADVGLETQTWSDGVIEVTHRYRSAIRKNYIIGGGSVTIKNITTQFPLTDVKLSLDVGNANDNPDWAVWMCDASGAGMKYRNNPLASALAPGQAVSRSYYYTTTPTGDFVPGDMSVDIDVMPQYTIDYNKDRPVGTIPVSASATAASDGAAQSYGRPIQDVDGLLQITDFQYTSTLAETESTRMISGTFTVTALFAGKQMTTSVAVEPAENDPYWDASSCDPSGKDATPSPWYPPAVTLTPTERSAKFAYQYNLEANNDPIIKDDFTINLHILPRIIVHYSGQDCFKSAVRANG